MSINNVCKDSIVRVPIQLNIEQEHDKINTFNPLEQKYNDLRALLDKTGRYTIDSHGHLCYIRNTNNGTNLIPLANFLAWPVYEVHRDDGREINKSFEIEGLLCDGRPLPTISVKSKDFFAMNWHIEWGLSANLDSSNGAKDKVRHCIQSLGSNVPTKNIYCHLGWRKIDGQWVYLHEKGAIGNDTVIVELDRDLHRYRLGDPARHCISRSLSLLKIAPEKITLPLWAMTFLAPLCEPLRRAEIEPAFILWVYGVTGCRKSTFTSLFLNHFGNFPDGKSLPGSFKDTANALEKSGFLAKDSLFIVDDYHPNNDLKGATKMRQTAQELLRAYGDRTGRRRMMANTELRPCYPPRGLCMVTGEDKPDGQSSKARYLTLEINKTDIDNALLTEAQNHKEELSQGMAAYIQWLAPQMDKLSDNLRLKFQQYRNKAQNDGHGRLSEGVAWLYIGMEMGLSFAINSEVINQEDANFILDKAWQTFIDMAEAQRQEIEEEKPTVKFLRILKELFDNRSLDVSYLSSYDDFLNINLHSSDIGWADNEWYYLLPNLVYKYVNRFCNEQGSNFPITARTLWKQLANEGLIMPDVKANRYTKVKKIKGENKRVLWLKKSALLE